MKGEPAPEARDPYFVAAVFIIFLVGTSVALYWLVMSSVYTCFEKIPLFCSVFVVPRW